MVCLESEMGECLISFGHTVGVVTLLDRRAFVVRSRDQLGSQTLCHRLFAARTGEGDQPAHGKRMTALGTHFGRHLVRGSTDTARTYFNHGRRIIHCLAEQLEAILAGLLLCY